MTKQREITPGERKALEKWTDRPVDEYPDLIDSAFLDGYRAAVAIVTAEFRAQLAKKSLKSSRIAVGIECVLQCLKERGE